MANHLTRSRPRPDRAAALSAAFAIVVLLAAGCVQLAPSAVPLALTATAAPVEASRPPEAPAATVVTELAAPGLPDPRTDPAAALRYSHFPASLSSVAFDFTSRLEADPAANYILSPDTERIVGRMNIVDLAAGRADMELHMNPATNLPPTPPGSKKTMTMPAGDSSVDAIRLGDRAWVRLGDSSWQEIDVAGLEDMGRLLGGVWRPLDLLEPFDSATEVTWVEDELLDGEPTHHLHVTLDPAKMQHLADTVKVRYEYYTEPLLNSHYGDVTETEVEADVWLAAKDLSVKQIDTRIRIVTQQDESGSGRTNWTIARTLKFAASDPNAIVAPEIPASVQATRTAGPRATETAVALATETAEAQLKLAKTAITAGSVLIPAGEFLMGSASGDTDAGASERPQHTVYLDAFWIDRVEVTNAMYARCVEAGACKTPTAYGNPSTNYLKAGRENYPIVFVSWSDAQAYCHWAGGRLPTEAEWEKAARGTDGRIYPWGNEPPNAQRCNFAKEHSGPNAPTNPETPVGAYPAGASPYGALDMAGNVQEWVADWIDYGYYATSPDRNPIGPMTGKYRGVRGGTFIGDQADVRAAQRDGKVSDDTAHFTGFRCARSETVDPRATLTAVAQVARATETAVAQLKLAEAALAAGPVFVPAGEFLMGSPDDDPDATAAEKPQHTVYLDAYWIDRVEVTNAMYARCVEAGKCPAWHREDSYNRANYYGIPEYQNYPVVFVTRDDAQAFCQWAGGRLPTEAEWEKAARGTDGRKYPWGNETPDCNRLNYAGADGWCVGDTTAVGAYPSNVSPYGALDMAGNVSEWVADWYDKTYYAASPARNPTGPASGREHVIRGGSWGVGRVDVRAAHRFGYPGGDVIVGFRCARSP